MLRNSPGPPPLPNVMDVTASRRMAAERDEAQLASLGPLSADLTETSQSIRMRDGHSSEVVITKPTGVAPSGGRPLIMIFFGGGFYLGSPKSMIPYARSFAHFFNAVCISANYRLAPEFKFPYAVHDAWDTLVWTAANADDLGATPSAGFIVGGISAGANLAAVLAQMAKEQQLEPKLTGQWLSIPVLFDEKMVPEKYRDLYLSWQQNRHGPVFGSELLEKIFSHWEADVKSPLFSPINSADPGEGLPPAYLQACGLDPLRDDALIYEKLLKEKGVRTRMDVYPGLPHGFWAFFKQLKSSDKARVDIAMGMGWLLGKELSAEEAGKGMQSSAMA